MHAEPARPCEHRETSEDRHRNRATSHPRMVRMPWSSTAAAAAGRSRNGPTKRDAAERPATRRHRTRGRHSDERAARTLTRTQPTDSSVGCAASFLVFPVVSCCWRSRPVPGGDREHRRIRSPVTDTRERATREMETLHEVIQRHSMGISVHKRFLLFNPPLVLSSSSCVAVCPQSFPHLRPLAPTSRCWQRPLSARLGSAPLQACARDRPHHSRRDRTDAIAHRT